MLSLILVSYGQYTENITWFLATQNIFPLLFYAQENSGHCSLRNSHFSHFCRRRGVGNRGLETVLWRFHLYPKRGIWKKRPNSVDLKPIFKDNFRNFCYKLGVLWKYPLCANLNCCVSTKQVVQSTHKSSCL